MVVCDGPGELMAMGSSMQKAQQRALPAGGRGPLGDSYSF